MAFRKPQPHTSDQSEPERYHVLGSSRADALGRFRVDIPRIALDSGDLTLVVGSTGWALTGKNLDTYLGKPDQAITIEPERVVRGRVLDLQGQPIAGVTVRVSYYETLPYDADGDAPPWPASATTDDKGRFELRGLGRGATVMLETSSDHHAPQTLNIDPRDEANAAELTITLSPAQVIEVHTFQADDGKPVTGTLVRVLSSRARAAWVARNQCSHQRARPRANHPFVRRHLHDLRHSASRRVLSEPAYGNQSAERCTPAIG